MPSNAVIGAAGLMVVPTAPDAWLIAATARATSSALSPFTPDKTSAGFDAASSLAKPWSVPASTPLSVAACGMLPLPASALAMASSLPGRHAIH